MYHELVAIVVAKLFDDVEQAHYYRHRRHHHHQQHDRRTGGHNRPRSVLPEVLGAA